MSIVNIMAVFSGWSFRSWPECGTNFKNENKGCTEVVHKHNLLFSKQFEGTSNGCGKKIYSRLLWASSSLLN